MTTIARAEKSHPKLVLTQPSAAPPTVLMLSGAAKAQVITPTATTAAKMKTPQFMGNTRPVFSTPMPGMRAGCTRPGVVTSSMTRFTPSTLPPFDVPRAGGSSWLPLFVGLVMSIGLPGHAHATRRPHRRCVPATLARSERVFGRSSGLDADPFTLYVCARATRRPSAVFP